MKATTLTREPGCPDGAAWWGAVESEPKYFVGSASASRIRRVSYVKSASSKSARDPPQRFWCFKSARYPL